MVFHSIFSKRYVDAKDQLAKIEKISFTKGKIAETAHLLIRASLKLKTIDIETI